MRYLKVLLLVLLFFFVMLFFVQNQASFSQSMPLKLDLIFFGPMESQPLPFYTLLLACFLLGALSTLLMLLWDRVTLSTRLTFTSMRARGLEKDAARYRKAAEGSEKRVDELAAKVSEMEKEAKAMKSSLSEAEARAVAAERAAAQQA